MNISDLINHAQKPALYEPGNSVMWTDPYISSQLLQVHLNAHTDLASRKPETIRLTADWILSHAKEEQLRILDLGCGPGLYSELLASRGHRVTGVDFSENSIAYARDEAQKKHLDISYLNEDYTQMDLPEDSFDLVMLIFTDFGPLMPAQRDQLLSKVRKVLKPGGLFVFDVLNDSNMESKLSPKSWEASPRGFWSEKPYLALSESYLYEEEKVIVYQHLVLDDTSLKSYRFWTHFFSNPDLREILESFDFQDISFHSQVIPDGDGYKSEDVTFCLARNS